MERPLKRRRLDNDAEFDLYCRRAQNDRRLKSTFEDIFEKYGKDFEGVGDEIDLETGEIVVNNGHVLGMANERDTGGVEDPEEEETEYDSEEWSESEGVVASSLLLETERRLDALKYAELLQRANEVGNGLPSEGDADSLIGDNDSLMGDSGLESTSLPPTRSSTFRPDSLCDDGSEDELASSDIEWPTPRKLYSTPREVWPTPNTVTPMIHTPWHSSPIKPVGSKKPPTEPMWTAPPLPTDDRLRKSAHPISGLQKASDVKFELPSDKPFPRNSNGAIPAQSIKSPRSPAKDSNRQKSQRFLTDETSPKSLIDRSRRQWTKEEENRLVQLRTSTRSTYSEIEPYFPSREVKAITIHWSEMKRGDRDLNSLHRSSVIDNAVLSPSCNSPWTLESSKQVQKTDMAPSLSFPTGPHVRSRYKGNDNFHKPYSSNLDLDCGLSPSKIMQTSKPREMKASESHSSMISQRDSSISPHHEGYAPLSRQSSRKASTSPYVKEEDDERSGVENAFPSPKADVYHAPRAAPPKNAVKVRSQAFFQPQIYSQQPKPKKSVGLDQKLKVAGAPSASLLTDQVSSSQRPSSSKPKKPVFLPSYLTDDSDDELSTPFKTVGAHRN